MNTHGELTGIVLSAAYFAGAHEKDWSKMTPANRSVATPSQVNVKREELFSPWNRSRPSTYNH